MNPTYLNIPSPLHELFLPEAEKNGIRIFMKRDDLIHPLLGGNKWRKLKYNLSKAKECGFDTILTFGGAWSNHIHATAAAGRLFGLKTIGIIRGEPQPKRSETLNFAIENGMTLHYIQREKYRSKSDDILIEELHHRFGEFYLIPEGGNNSEGITGAGDITGEINVEFDYFCASCGTGTTLSGIMKTCSDKKLLGFSALKGGEFLNDEILKNAGSGNNSLRIISDYHFGGYAKVSSDLKRFILDFYRIHNITLDPVYTGKMMFGIIDLLKKRYFEDGSCILVYHSGGLQGIAGYPDLHSRLLENQAS